MATQSTKHQPATALPWKYAGSGSEEIYSTLTGICVAIVNHSPAMYDGFATRNATYAAHAANAYPRLVAELRSMLALSRAVAPTAQSRAGVMGNADALLRELGELT